MKTWFTIILCIFSFVQILGQRLEQETTVLNLGTVFENVADSVTTLVWNRHSDTISLEEVNSFGLYDNIPYQVKWSKGKIAPGDSSELTIVFQPLHNIAHNLPVIIENSGERGPIHYEIQAQGSYSDSYYSSTENLNEQALKTAIKSRLASGYIQHSYNAARDEMYMKIDNQRTNGRGATQNTLEGMYTARLALGYSSRSQAQINDQFNTEHVWPQGMFNQNLPMRSDLHHLFPTWDQANSARGSFRFGNVTGNGSWSSGGSKLQSGVFSPRDYAKGRTARCMMYFVLRYQNYNNFMNAQEADLRGWHKQFPPDAIDRKRNNDTYAFQGNKNPLVDYPQLIDRITSLSANSVAAANLSMTLVEDSINYGRVQNGSFPIYYYMIVNDGNQPLELTNFVLTNPGLSFDIGGNDVSLDPQDVHIIGVTLNNAAEGDFQAQLRFTSNVAAGQQIIPITAKVEAGVGFTPSIPSTISVYPSPVSDKLFVQWEGNHPAALVTVSDLNGRILMQSSLQPQEVRKQLDVRALSSGVYQVQVNGWFFKFVKD